MVYLETVHGALKRDLPFASQFGFYACNSTALACMRFTDHTHLNFTNDMSTVVVFLYLEKAFDKT
jgi:hypothetical protein